MNWLIISIHAHPAIWGIGAFWVSSAAIGALPTPATGSAGFYRWFFDFSHVLSANIFRVIATRYPQMQMTGNQAAAAQANGQAVVGK